MGWVRNRYLQGSVTLEASIVIPVVVVCILPFVYLFRMMLFQMILEKNLDDCMREMAAEVYILERVSIMPTYNEEDESVELAESQLDQIKALIDEYTELLEEDGWKKKMEEMGFELLGELLLEEKLKKRMENESLEVWGIAKGWEGLSFSDSDFFYSQEGHHCLLKGEVSFEWERVFSFWNPGEVKIKRVYHSFVGEQIWQVEGDETGEKEKTEKVYIIGSGTRYHKSSCYLICKNTYVTSKSNAEQKGWDPCARCNPQNEVTVYGTSGGEHYHIGTCSYLYPETTSMLLEEAVMLGYSGCRICQGDNNYFS